MKNKSFVIFLDIDGVLNSRSTVKKTPDGYQGIDDARVEVLAKWELHITAHTYDQLYDRGVGIENYLREHSEIEEYVILDDNKFDFEDYPGLGERLLLTDGIERAKFASRAPEVEAILFRDYIQEV